MVCVNVVNGKDKQNQMMINLHAENAKLLILVMVIYNVVMELVDAFLQVQLAEMDRSHFGEHKRPLEGLDAFPWAIAWRYF